MRDNIKEKIYSTFADTASSLGYSDVHGRIIGCLMVYENPISLSEIAKETGKPVRTIFNRINRDVDPYQKNKSVKKPQVSTLWEGVPDHIRKACESGSNKDLLAV